MRHFLPFLPGGLALLALAACDAPPTPGAVAEPAAATGYHLAAMKDAYAAGRFAVEIDGKLVGSLPSFATGVPEPKAFKDGDDPITHKRAGRARVITDRDTGRSKGFGIVRDDGSGMLADRGVFRLDPEDPLASTLVAWRKRVLAGKVERKSISIVFHDDGGEEARRATFFEAWPCRWKAPELNAGSDAHGMALIEIAFERLEMK
jgi:hypothetical protein